MSRPRLPVALAAALVAALALAACGSPTAPAARRPRPAAVRASTSADSLAGRTSTADTTAAKVDTTRLSRHGGTQPWY